MTAQEILDYVEESGISESDFGYGEFSDQNLFQGYSEELKSHMEACEGMSWRGQNDYEKEHLGGKSIWTLQAEEFKAAGSPKSPLGEWEEVKQYGGEGQGDTWYSVKYFKDHNVYLRTDGWYSSYNGTDFNDGYGYEVKPQQKTITVFE